MSTSKVAASTKTVKTAKKSTTTKKAAPAKKSAESVAEGAQTEKKERKRRDVSKESIDSDFDALQTRIEAEITRLRDPDNKGVRGIKFLRSVNKALKTLHSDTKRVMKLKKKNNRKKTVVSGFLKPIRITKELAEFTGWDLNKEYSRVAVTKHICEYIKERHLFNDTDKRLILCDDKLKKLLNYDPANLPTDKNGDPAPLNYFRLQKYLKPHFIKIEVKVDESKEAKTEEKPAKKTSTKPKAAKKASAQTQSSAAAPTQAKSASKSVTVDEEDELVEEETE